ncbi:MAG: hypothetical protein ACRDKW_15850 [Actinomycetota bacterium]
MTLRIASLLLLVLALACTTTPDPGPLSTPAPETAGYVERWNASCRGMPGRVAEILKTAFARQVPEAAPAPDTVRRAADQVAAAVRGPLDSVRTLPVPTGEGTVVADLLAAFEAGLATIAQQPGSIASIGTGLPEDPFARADQLAIGFGAGRCALSSADQGGD